MSALSEDLGGRETHGHVKRQRAHALEGEQPLHAVAGCDLLVGADTLGKSSDLLGIEHLDPDVVLAKRKARQERAVELHQRDGALGRQVDRS